jgi:hypothetical protein
MQRSRWAAAVVGLVVAGLALGAVSGCASTKFKSTWKDPTVAQMDLRAKKVAVLVVSPSEAVRLQGETALARELTKRGVQPIMGHDILEKSDLGDRGAIMAKLREAGAEGAVVMRVIDRRQEVNYTPGPGYYGPSFGGYWGYGWSAVSDPGYLTTDTVVSVETLVYSVPDDKLVWAGISDTYDPEDVGSAIKDIVGQAAKEMKKAGLIKG